MADPAPTTTQTMVTTIGATVAKNLLMTLGASLAAHGIISGSNTETVVSLGMALIGAGWSFYNSYGRAILIAKLQVWKAKAEAQADAIRKANVLQPSDAQIADKIPDPAVTAAVVAKTTAACLALALILLATPSFAQRADDMKQVGPAKRPGFNATGNLGADIKNAISGDTAASATQTRQQVVQALAKPFQDLADFIGDDSENAITLSTSIPGVQDGHGQQCWIAARNFTAVFKAHPLPLTGQAMTDLEALRLLAISSKQLCEDTHCTQVFTDFKNMATIIAQGVAGQLGATAVRAAPSLQDICVLVPNIPLADAINPVPPAPTIKPVGLGSSPPPAPTTPAAPQ